MEDKKEKRKCCDCGEEKEDWELKEDRNGMTCRKCIETFKSNYDDYVDPLHIYH